MAINKLLKLIRFKRLMQIVRIKVTSIIMDMLLGFSPIDTVIKYTQLKLSVRYSKVSE